MEKRQIVERRQDDRRTAKASTGVGTVEKRTDNERRADLRPNGNTKIETLAVPRRKQIYLIRRDKERKIQETRKEQRLRKELGLV